MRWVAGAMVQVVSAAVEHPIGTNQHQDPGYSKRLCGARAVCREEDVLGWGYRARGADVRSVPGSICGTWHWGHPRGSGLDAQGAGLDPRGSGLDARGSKLGVRCAEMRGSFPRCGVRFPVCGVRVPGEVFASHCGASVRASV